jgi:hypothetical protein
MRVSLKFGRLIPRAFVTVLLCVLTVPSNAATDTEINQAIQDGLSWLATTQNSSGAFVAGGYYLANTATAVLAFENEGHFPGGGTTYSSHVENGLDYLFTRCQKLSMNPQTSGYPGRFDEYGNEIVDLSPPPIVEVKVLPHTGSSIPGWDGELLPPGLSDDGNEFRYDLESGKWTLNLGMKTYTASTTYMISVLAGDNSYAIEGCTESFTRQ